VEAGEAVALPPEGHLLLLLYGELLCSRPDGREAIVRESSLLPAAEFGNSSFLPETDPIYGTTVTAARASGYLLLSDAELHAAQAQKGNEIVAFIQSVPMLSSLPTDKLARLVASLHTRRYKRQEVVFEQGETPQGLGIVREGRCGVMRTIPFQTRHGERERQMRLDTLLPRDTFGGDSVLQGALRNHASVVAETDVTMLHVPRSEFGPNLLSDEALRILQLNTKLYRPSDEMLRKRYENEHSWRIAKQHYIREVIQESKDQKIINNRLSRNPNLLPATGALGGSPVKRSNVKEAWGTD